MDRSLFRELMAQIAAEMDEMVQLECEFGYHAARGILWGMLFTLVDVHGLKKDVWLRLRGVPDDSTSNGIVGGSFNDEDEPFYGVSGPFPPRLTINVNTTRPWREISNRRNRKELAITLLHELVHAMDVLSDESAGRGVSQPGEEGFDENTFWPLYLSDADEVRALMAEIFGEIRVHVKRAVRRDGTDGMVALMDALSRNHAWAFMSSHLTPKNRNLILKGLVTALEDEGVITVR